MYLNFGNGIIAGGTSRDSVRIVDFIGLDVPIPSATFQEHGVLDGGKYVATRVPTRAMAVTMDTTAYTRQQIHAAFLTGVRYTLTSDRGSMPYYVESITPESANQRGKYRFTVAIRSPQAYPVSGYGSAILGASTPLEITSAGIEITSAGIAIETFTGVTSATIVNDGELCVEPRITLTAASTGTLTLSHSAGSFIVAVTAGDEVVIDTATRSITIDGVSALSSFDRASIWPILCPGVNTITVSQSVVMSVGWSSLVVGLI